MVHLSKPAPGLVIIYVAVTRFCTLAHTAPWIAVIVFNKIVQQWWMKIALQDAIAAIHSAVGTDMQYLIAAAYIVTGARA